MTFITVDDILSLLVSFSQVRIWMDNKTYLFDEDTLPDSIRNARVSSIDDPANTKNEPLCINLVTTDDESEKFYEENKDYLIG